MTSSDFEIPLEGVPFKADESCIFLGGKKRGKQQRCSVLEKISQLLIYRQKFTSELSPLQMPQCQLFRPRFGSEIFKSHLLRKETF